MSDIVKYSPNMYLRKMPEDGLYLLENVLYKACIVAGMKIRPEGSPEKAEQCVRILAQSELIKRRYSDFTLEDVQEALEMAYCEGLAGIEQKDIVKNPTKILNKFREIRAFRKNANQSNYAEMADALQEAMLENLNEKKRLIESFNQVVGIGKHLAATTFTLQELFFYAHLYDMLYMDMEMQSEQVKNEVYGIAFKKLISSPFSGISSEQKQEIIAAKKAGEWHEIIQKEAKVSLKASLAANAINQQIKQNATST